MGHLRIVAGELRGRRFRVPSDLGVRPTTDRVREALFAILGPAVVGARVLDVYCGSGALGFEALSRGAASVMFLDVDRRCLAVARDNAEKLGLIDRAGFVRDRALRWLERTEATAPFDLVLADPPYGSGDRGGLVAAAGARLSPGGRLVVERPTRAPAVQGAGGLELARSARYGDSTLDIYDRSAARH